MRTSSRWWRLPLPWSVLGWKLDICLLYSHIFLLSELASTSFDGHNLSDGNAFSLVTVEPAYLGAVPSSADFAYLYCAPLCYPKLNSQRAVLLPSFPNPERQTSTAPQDDWGKGGYSLCLRTFCTWILDFLKKEIALIKGHTSTGCRGPKRKGWVLTPKSFIRACLVLCSGLWISTTSSGNN